MFGVFIDHPACRDSLAGVGSTSEAFFIFQQQLEQGPYPAAIASLKEISRAVCIFPQDGSL